MNENVELRIPEEFRLEAKKLTDSYHRQAQHHDDETKKMINREVRRAKKQKAFYIAATTLEEALTKAVESENLGFIIELPEKDNGAAYAVVELIVPFLFSGARCVVRDQDVLDAYEAVTGKQSPIPRISLDEEDNTDTIEEI